MKNDEMRKAAAPDFLIVGLQKSASYWVTALFDAHPEISCFPILANQRSGVGEGHFFDLLGLLEEGREDDFRKTFTKKHYGYFADLMPFLKELGRDEFYKIARERSTVYTRTSRSFVLCVISKIVWFHIIFIELEKAEKIELLLPMSS
jgi:hypothetical protein